MVTISSRKKPLIAHLKKLGADRNYRRQTGTFLCEGTKLLNEALKAGLNIETVLTSDSEPILPVAEKRSG
jgi:TrmH family RNA methyltransferase